MEKIYEENRLKREAKKEEFLKKKNSEKFKFLYDEIQEIDDEIADLDSRNECECSCDCSENSEWIEKIKHEQQCFLDRIEDLESEFYSFKEKISEVGFIEEYLEMKKTIKKFEAEERTRKFFGK